jgi:outer membrane protein
MIENMQVEYNKLIDDFEKNQGTYSELVRKTKQSEILEVQDKINNFQQNASQQLQQKNIELLQPIY